MKGFHDLLKDSDGNSKELKELDIEQFKKALAQVDSQVKMLPATAQESGTIYERSLLERQKNAASRLLFYIALIFLVNQRQQIWTFAMITF